MDRFAAIQTFVAVAYARRALDEADEAEQAAQLDDDRVLELLPEWTLPPLDLWALFSSGRRVDAKARALVDFVQSSLEADANASAQGRVMHERRISPMDAAP